MVESEYKKLLASGRVYFGKDGNAQPSIIRYLSEVDGFVPWTWWSFDEVGHTDEAKKEILALFSGGELFGTPKPERLLNRILHIATNTGDLVLDSFLGSGTTSAVAHKMGRRYIGIEMGEHCITHCAPRLKKVVEGEQGGISEAVNWQGGGGFRFYRLGAPVFDEHGKINPAIRFAHLASHIWFSETRTALDKPAKSPLLGIFNGVAYYLLYNGILGDKRPDGGNVLTNPVLRHLPPFDGPKVIYGESSRLGTERLKTEGITFKQTPYDIKAR
jgi:adenine-specific DNA-methyltransferase